MEYTAEVLRGWPTEGALERVELPKAAVTLVNGDIVEMQSDGTVDKVSATANGNVGLVIRGNGDSASVVQSGKCLVLWSNYIVRVSNYAGTPVVGTKMTGKSGKFTPDSGSDPIVGFVVKVQAATATETAHVVIVVK